MSDELTQYAMSFFGWTRCLLNGHSYDAKREIYTLETTKQPNGDPTCYVFYNRCCSGCGKIDPDSAEWVENEYDPMDGYFE